MSRDYLVSIEVLMKSEGRRAALLKKQQKYEQKYTAFLEQLESTIANGIAFNKECVTGKIEASTADLRFSDYLAQYKKLLSNALFSDNRLSTEGKIKAYRAAGSLTNIVCNYCLFLAHAYETSNPEQSSYYDIIHNEYASIGARYQQHLFAAVAQFMTETQELEERLKRLKASAVEEMRSGQPLSLPLAQLKPFEDEIKERKKLFTTAYVYHSTEFQHFTFHVPYMLYCCLSDENKRQAAEWMIELGKGAAVYGNYLKNFGIADKSYDANNQQSIEALFRTLQAAVSPDTIRSGFFSFQEVKQLLEAYKHCFELQNQLCQSLSPATAQVNKDIKQIKNQQASKLVSILVSFGTFFASAHDYQGASECFELALRRLEEAEKEGIKPIHLELFEKTHPFTLEACKTLIQQALTLAKASSNDKSSDKFYVSHTLTKELREADLCSANAYVSVALKAVLFEEYQIAAEAYFKIAAYLHKVEGAEKAKSTTNYTILLAEKVRNWDLGLKALSLLPEGIVDEQKMHLFLERKQQEEAVKAAYENVRKSGSKKEELSDERHQTEEVFESAMKVLDIFQERMKNRYELLATDVQNTSEAQEKIEEVLEKAPVERGIYYIKRLSKYAAKCTKAEYNDHDLVSSLAIKIAAYVRHLPEECSSKVQLEASATMVQINAKLALSNLYKADKIPSFKDRHTKSGDVSMKLCHLHLAVNALGEALKWWKNIEKITAEGKEKIQEKAKKELHTQLSEAQKRCDKVCSEVQTIVKEFQAFRKMPAYTKKGTIDKPAERTQKNKYCLSKKEVFAGLKEGIMYMIDSMSPEKEFDPVKLNAYVMSSGKEANDNQEEKKSSKPGNVTFGQFLANAMNVENGKSEGGVGKK